MDAHETQKITEAIKQLQEVRQSIINRLEEGNLSDDDAAEADLEIEEIEYALNTLDEITTDIQEVANAGGAHIAEVAQEDDGEIDDDEDEDE